MKEFSGIRLYHASHPLHLEFVDIAISKEGILTQLKKSNHTSSIGISTAWIDSYATFGEPGNTQKETFKSGSLAAAIGGFKHVVLSPNTNPIRQYAEFIEKVNQQNHSSVKLHPLGAATDKLESKKPAEILEQLAAGAIGFTNAESPVSDAGNLQRILQYTTMRNTKFMYTPLIPDIAGCVYIPDGEVSIRTGFEGNPSISETIAIQRDIALLEYYGGSLIWNKITSKDSIPLIQEAKAKGLNVFATVSIWNLAYNSDVHYQFSPYWKQFPTIRHESDRLALVEAVKNGIIDAIVSDHYPHDFESKEKEYEYASHGLSGIETVFPLALQAFGDENIQDFITALTTGPAQFWNIPTSTFEIGSKIEATIFDSKIDYQFHTASKGINHVLHGNFLVGKSIEVV